MNFYALGQSRERGGGAPRLELIQLVAERIDEVLRDQRHVVAELVRFDDLIAVANPGCVAWFVRMVGRRPTAVDQRPDSETRPGRASGCDRHGQSLPCRSGVSRCADVSHGRCR
jgi:hypothetical protein